MTGRNKFWGKFQLVSDRQIELALSINAYRKKYNISQKEMAHICTLYGKPHNVKFTQTQISSYETMKTAPRTVHYQILCNVLDINPTI